MNWRFLKRFKQIIIKMFGNYLPHVSKRIETKITSKGTEQPLGQSTRGTNDGPTDSINDMTNSHISPDKGKLLTISDKCVYAQKNNLVLLKFENKCKFSYQSTHISRIQ